MMTVRIAEGVDRGTERLVGILVDIDQPGQRRGDTKVEPMALGVEGVGHRLFDDVTGRRAEPGGRGGVDAATASPRPARDRRGAVGQPGLGGGQEALQVTETVAPVASRVDPVVAQPARVAPRSDRVRMHAEQPGGLGDRQGRVRGSGGE